MTTALAPSLQIGPLTVDLPVVLAPMAGVTNAAYRSLCRSYGAGLYVSEMVSARALLEVNETTSRRASFGPDETVRSIQLYATNPDVVGAAAAAHCRRTPSCSATSSGRQCARPATCPSR